MVYKKTDRKIIRTPIIYPKPRSQSRPGGFFLDSGAHSLYNVYAHDREQSSKFDYFNKKEFWEYVDSYAAFVKRFEPAFDYYVNVDVIHNPTKSWEVQQYLENEHGLNPVPVVHAGTPVKWLQFYIDKGYDPIGIGGVALGSSHGNYTLWADQIFACACDTKDKLPQVRLHGFSITTYKTLIKYPWWSVDSTSWAKWSGYGILYVPKLSGGQFNFKVNPYPIFVSQESPRTELKGRHIYSLIKGERKIFDRWLDEIGVPLGSETEWGVVSENSARIIANLKFFEMMIESLPDYPWPYNPTFVDTNFGKFTHG